MDNTVCGELNILVKLWREIKTPQALFRAFPHPTGQLDGGLWIAWVGYELFDQGILF